MMEYIYMVREYLKAIYTKLDIYIVSIAKFLLAFFVLRTINFELGFLDKINDSAIVVLVSLVCALLPWGVSVAMAAVFVLGHFYALSLELAGVVLVLFIIMFCMYLRFGTGDSIYILLTLTLFFINMPYFVPVFTGLTAGSVTAAIPVAFGIIIYYLIGFAVGNAEFLGQSGTEGMLDRFKFIIDNALQDRQMFLMIIAFAVTIVLVYTIRKLAIDYSWFIAIIFGIAVDIIILLIGKAMFKIDISTASLILGSIASIIIMTVLQMFIFAVDYRKKVSVQFEDEDYVYYVKAVPKLKYDLNRKPNNIIKDSSKKQTVNKEGKKRPSVRREGARKAARPTRGQKPPRTQAKPEATDKSLHT